MLEIEENRKKKFKTQNGLLILCTDDVLFCKSEGSYTLIQFVDGTSKVITTHLKNVQKHLPEKYFYRIHRSFIVNVRHIIEIRHIKDNKVVMKDNTELKFSKREKKRFLKFISEINFENPPGLTAY